MRLIESEDPIEYYMYFRNGKKLVTPSYSLAANQTDNGKIEKWQKKWKNKDKLTVTEPEMLGIIEVEEE